MASFWERVNTVTSSATSLASQASKVGADYWKQTDEYAKDVPSNNSLPSDIVQENQQYNHAPHASQINYQQNWPQQVTSDVLPQQSLQDTNTTWKSIDLSAEQFTSNPSHLTPVKSELFEHYPDDHRGNMQESMHGHQAPLSSLSQIHPKQHQQDYQPEHISPSKTIDKSEPLPKSLHDQEQYDKQHGFGSTASQSHIISQGPNSSSTLYDRMQGKKLCLNQMHIFTLNIIYFRNESKRHTCNIGSERNRNSSGSSLPY